VLALATLVFRGAFSTSQPRCQSRKEKPRDVALFRGLRSREPRSRQDHHRGHLRGRSLRRHRYQGPAINRSTGLLTDDNDARAHRSFACTFTDASIQVRFDELPRHHRSEERNGRTRLSCNFGGGAGRWFLERGNHRKNPHPSLFPLVIGCSRARPPPSPLHADVEGWG
jgi:hypothetical protein